MKKRWVSWLLVLTLLLGFLLCTATALAQGANPASTVIDGKTSDRVHLRAEPSKDAKSLGIYFTGTQVLYDASAGGAWTWVTIGAQSGYIASQYLYRGKNPGSVASRQPPGVVTNVKAGSWVNLRSAPSQQARVAGTLYKDDWVTVLGETVTKWYYVQAGGAYGYVMADFLQVGQGPAPSQPPPGPVPPPRPTGTTPGNQAALGAFWTVLLGNASLFSPDHNQPMDIFQLADTIPGPPGIITQFTVIDLDRDGVVEIVLRLMADGYDSGVEILRYQDGSVYGYGISLRAFMDLKADGTFWFSSGAADNGFGALQFAPDALFHYDNITYSESHNEDENQVSYYVNRRPASQAAYRRAVEQWDKRPAATWQDFAQENMEALLRVYK